MSESAERNLDLLRRRLAELAPVAVAVSGGVDSMTLAVVAHRTLGEHCTMLHAISPAVPAHATERVARYAQHEGWRVQTIDAGEFADSRYMANPSNRCYFCKSNLYGDMASRTDHQLLSGTNTDDLGDYRPGLQAASEHAVAHPYVDCGIAKADVRAIARWLKLDDLAELPAAPCLSSRVETGIAIDADVLGCIEQVESELQALLGPATLRCRVRAGGVVIELESALHERLDSALVSSMETRVRAIFERVGLTGPIAVEPYRRGSAFLIGEIRVAG